MTSDSIIKTTDYCGSLIYEQGRPKMLLVDGGYVTFNDNANGNVCDSLQWHYYLTDHLGNNRVVVNSNDSIEQVNHYYPYGGLMAESTGGDTQRYKYNGKELDRMHGLDWMDYGARWMNGLTFTTPDPKAWDYTDVSPYAYCHNNPVNRIDPDGRDDYYLYPNGLVKHIKGSESNNQTDRLFVKGSNNSTSITIGSGILNQLTSKKNGFDGHQASIKNSDDAFKLFKFAADNSNVEWGLDGFSGENGMEYNIRTTNKTDGVGLPNYGSKIGDMEFSLHSHTKVNGNDKASGNYDIYTQYREGASMPNYYFPDSDLKTMNDIYNRFQQLHGAQSTITQYPQFYIYNSKSGNVFRYSLKKNIIAPHRINHYKHLQNIVK